MVASVSSLFCPIYFAFSGYASQAVADIVRTTLGPRSMLKMLLDAAGGGLSSHFIVNASTCNLVS